MPALVEGIHVFWGALCVKDVNGRDKPGHDGWEGEGTRSPENALRLKRIIAPRHVPFTGDFHGVFFAQYGIENGCRGSLRGNSRNIESLRSASFLQVQRTGAYARQVISCRTGAVPNTADRCNLPAEMTRSAFRMPQHCSAASARSGRRLRLAALAVGHCRGQAHATKGFVWPRAAAPSSWSPAAHREPESQDAERPQQWAAAIPAAIRRAGPTSP